MTLRKLVYYVATTLDGFTAGPEGGDPSGAGYFPLTPDGMQYIVENYSERMPGPAREALGIDHPGRTFLVNARES